MTPHDVNPSQGFRPPEDRLRNDWGAEELYWRDSWQSRPYTSADLGFDYYRPAYRYGFESARDNFGRTWDELESDLRAGWEKYEYRSKGAWENVKDAVRDAWHRVTKD